MSKTVGYAVVGLGVGCAHVTGALDAEGCKLVAVCDKNPGAIEALFEKEPRAKGVKTYADFTEMLKNPEIDVVSIATPSGMHSDMAIEALYAGKHVLTEKPMDVTVGKILAIEEARKKTRLKVGGVFQNRRNAIMGPYKEAIDSGRLGKIFYGYFRVNWYREDSYFLQNGGWRGTWAMDGGGSLMNQGVHTVDLMQWLLGDVASVRSEMSIINHNIETEDFTCSTIKFKSGAIAHLMSTTCAYPGNTTDIQITGTKGSIYVDFDKPLLWRIRGEGMEAEEKRILADYSGGGSVAADPKVVRGHSFMIQDMVDAVRFDRDPMVSPLEAVKAVKIINAVYESAKTGKEIFF